MILSTWPLSPNRCPSCADLGLGQTSRGLVRPVRPKGFVLLGRCRATLREIWRFFQRPGWSTVPLDGWKSGSQRQKGCPDEDDLAIPLEVFPKLLGVCLTPTKFGEVIAVPKE